MNRYCSKFGGCSSFSLAYKGQRNLFYTHFQLQKLDGHIRHSTENSDVLILSDLTKELSFSLVNLKKTTSNILLNRKILYKFEIFKDLLTPYQLEITALFHKYFGKISKENSCDSCFGMNKNSKADHPQNCMSVYPMNDLDLQTVLHQIKRLNFSSNIEFYESLIISSLVSDIDGIKSILECWKISLKNENYLKSYEGFPYKTTSGIAKNKNTIKKENAAIDSNSFLSRLYQMAMISLLLRSRDCSENNDFAFFLFGQSLREHIADNELWYVLFLVCAINNTSEHLFSRWLERFCDFYTDKALPFNALYAILSWCVSNRQIKMAHDTYSMAAKKNGILPPSYSQSPSNSVTKSIHRLKASEKLQMLARLAASVKSVRFDGGVREVVIKGLCEGVSSDVLMDAPWEVINDLLSALSIESAIRLIHFRSYSEEKRHGAVPFYIWATLLRRCTKDHYIEESESIFSFIRYQFSPKIIELMELVEIIIRMYATLPQPDFTSALWIFKKHVINSCLSDGTSATLLKLPNIGIIYELLIQSAVSQEPMSASMLFLEACAMGIPLSNQVYTSLFSLHPQGKLNALSRKLPYEVRSSRIDAMINIPANVDAHLHREIAQLARSKKPVDSTGEVI